MSGALIFSGTLTNSGTISQQGSGVLGLNGGAGTTITNQGVYDFHGDGILSFGSGGGTLANTSTGTVRKSAGTGMASVFCTFTSSGSFDIQANTGTLGVRGTFNGGNFTVATGATLDLTEGSPSTFTGNFTGTAAGGAVFLNSGSISIGSAGATFNFPAGLFQWSGGSIVVSTGTLTNAATGFITLNAPSATFLALWAPTVNAGTIKPGPA